MQLSLDGNRGNRYDHHTYAAALGSGSKDGGCPALYALDEDQLVMQGIAARGGTAVLVPHALLDWAEPETTVNGTWWLRVKSLARRSRLGAVLGRPQPGWTPAHTQK